jgi:hypothetical protein
MKPSLFTTHMIEHIKPIPTVKVRENRLAYATCLMSCLIACSSGKPAPTEESPKKVSHDQEKCDLDSITKQKEAMKDRIKSHATKLEFAEEMALALAVLQVTDKVSCLESSERNVKK